MVKESPFQPKQQIAISLVELMLSLAVISMLLLMSTRYFSSVQYQQRVNHTATIVRDIISAAHSWGESNPDMSEINMQNLIKVNLLPASYLINPWGGAVIVSPKPGDSFTFAITLRQLPTDACSEIKKQFSDYTITCLN